MKLGRKSKIIAAVVGGSLSFPAVGEAQSTFENVSCVKTKKVKRFFRRLAEVTSLAEPLVGISEISTKDPMDVAHYRIVRDDCGESTEISYYHGDTPKPIDENFTANRFVPASKVTIKRLGNQARMRFFDNAGAPKTVFDGVQSIKMMFDQKGNLVRADFLDANNTLTNSSLGYASVAWHWKNQSNAVETRYDAANEKVLGRGDFPFHEASIEFDEFGFAKSIYPDASDNSIHISRTSSYARQSWYILDQHGAPSRGGSAGIARAQYSYDENGYLVQLQYLDEEGNPLIARSGHMGFAREYDSAGNRLSYHFIDSGGEVWTPPLRGYAGQRYQWRKDGIVRLQASYVDVDGQAINHPDRGYASVTYEFDENNIETGRILMDKNGDVVAE